MEALRNPTQEHGHDQFVADLPTQVIMALDHLTSEEQEGVFAAVQAFTRHEKDGARLPLPEPLYALRAAPEVLVIVRGEPGTAVEIEDIVRPAALRHFTHVG